MSFLTMQRLHIVWQRVEAFVRYFFCGQKEPRFFEAILFDIRVKLIFIRRLSAAVSIKMR